MCACSQLCGIYGTTAYLLVAGTTKIITVNINTGATADAVTGLTADGTACALDAAGSGALIVATGSNANGKIYVVPAATTLPVAASGLTAAASLTLPTSMPIFAVAGLSASSTFYVSIAGNRTYDPSMSTYAYTTYTQIWRVIGGTATSMTSSSSAAPISSEYGSGELASPLGAGGNEYYAHGLALRADGSVLYVASTRAGVAGVRNPTTMVAFGPQVRRPRAAGWQRPASAAP